MLSQVAASLPEFVVGILLLIKGADFFVGGGSGLAVRYRVSPALIGFTVIAFGTSLPELVVNLQAAAAAEPDLALGNIVGSTVANIALVLAVVAVVNPEALQEGTHGMRQVAVMLAAVVAFALLALRGVFDLPAGITMLGAFALTMAVLWRQGVVTEETFESRGIRDVLLTGGGLIAVILGSWLLVESATRIAVAFGISPFVIGVSMVAVGTSLPELATSLTAAVRGAGAISVGNIVGSNTFNVLFVMGCAAIVLPIPVGSYADVFVMLGFAVAILPFFSSRVQVRRGWGLVMLLAYAGYIGLLFGLV
ncbi:calcium/sodium antiporter [Methanoculleus oceani]|uniref:Conjugal transfer protein TraR n=1 Tax=Methanoculleus oceani TaxID=2184756 RepID=A0ABD4TAK3_9EURY|nr:calcium/sodium antiporter [Methanoculleus sp. CWC-02]MCM2465536.1 conjugal transfer protein TraR [Methanoculleus sp. CWC-02]